MARLPEHLKSAAPVGRQKLPRAVREEHQRDRVIAAAIEVFSRRGYPETTMDRIVTAARTGVGTFYSLFDGKEDCFLQAYDRTVADASERIVAAIPPRASWPEQVCFAVRRLLELIAAEPLRARIVLVEAQTAGPKALARYDATLDRVTAQLRRGRALTPKAAAPLPDTLEHATVGGVLWLLQQRVVKREPDVVGELLGQLLEMILEPYLGERETARLIAEWESGAGSGAPTV